MKKMNVSTARMNIDSRRKPKVSRGGITSYQQIRALARSVRMITPEIKFFDTDLLSTNISLTVPPVTNIVGVAQGDDQGDRTADSIRVKSITLCGTFNNAAYVTANTNELITGVRWALVLDKQQVADTNPTAALMFKQVTACFDLLPNVDSLGRFKILHLSRFMPGNTFVPKSTTDFNTPIPPVVEWNWTGDIEVRYNGSAGTDLQKNGIFFIVFATQAAGTAAFDFLGTARIGYIDS